MFHTLGLNIIIIIIVCGREKKNSYHCNEVYGSGDGIVQLINEIKNMNFL